MGSERISRSTRLLGKAGEVLNYADVLLEATGIILPDEFSSDIEG